MSTVKYAHGLYQPNTLGADFGLGLISSASVARIFYTSSTPFTDDFTNNGTGYAFNTLEQSISAFPTDCARTNAMGYDQALYLDVFPAGSTFDRTDRTGRSDVLGDVNLKAPIFIYIHGGGFSGGEANGRKAYESIIGPACALGYHVISWEYRRGWVPLMGDNYIGPVQWLLNDEEFGTGKGFTQVTSDIFKQTADGIEGLALKDQMDAWEFIDKNIKTVLPNAIKKYILCGTSAGGSSVYHLTVSPGKEAPSNRWKSLNKKVLLSMPLFGTGSIDGLIPGDGVLAVPKFPIVLQGCGMDQLSPFRSSHIFWQDKMVEAIGVYDAYKKLDEFGSKVFLMYGPTEGHGLGTWIEEGPLEFLEAAINIGKRCHYKEEVPDNHVWTKIPNNSAGNQMHTELGYPAPGYRCTIGNPLIYSLYSKPFTVEPIDFYNELGEFWINTYNSSNIGNISLEGQNCRMGLGMFNSSNYLSNFDQRNC